MPKLISHILAKGRREGRVKERARTLKVLDKRIATAAKACSHLNNYNTLALDALTALRVEIENEDS